MADPEPTVFITHNCTECPMSSITERIEEYCKHPGNRKYSEIRTLENSIPVDCPLRERSICISLG
jgi:hypothetical protein